MRDFFDEFEYRSANAMLRYYPQGCALDRFFLGVRVGVSIAAGATRRFGSELDGATVTLPSIRLINIGLAF